MSYSSKIENYRYIINIKETKNCLPYKRKTMGKLLWPKKNFFINHLQIRSLLTVINNFNNTKEKKNQVTYLA